MNRKYQDQIITLTVQARPAGFILQEALNRLIGFYNEKSKEQKVLKKIESELSYKLNWAWDARETRARTRRTAKKKR